MSYERMLKGEAQLEAEVKRWFADAEAADTRDDQEEGRGRRGDELPTWVVDKQKRLEKIREARAALEAEARRRPSARSLAGAAARAAAVNPRR